VNALGFTIKHCIRLERPFWDKHPTFMNSYSKTLFTIGGVGASPRLALALLPNNKGAPLLGMLLAQPSNIALGLKGLTGTNTQCFANYDLKVIYN
jgi:hypothetical protein